MQVPMFPDEWYMTFWNGFVDIVQANIDTILMFFGCMIASYFTIWFVNWARYKTSQ